MAKPVSWVKYQSPVTVFSLTKFDFIFSFLMIFKGFLDNMSLVNAWGTLKIVYFQNGTFLCCF